LISPTHEETASLTSQDPGAARRNCAEQVYSALKSDIVKGILVPGTLLSESALATRFGISRTPVREALTILARDGLVTTLPQRGHVVNTVTLTEALDAFRLRGILDAEAAAQAARRINDAQIAHLRQLIEIRESDDLPAVNREFHTGIARIGGNRLLVDFVDRLLMCMERILLLGPRASTWTQDGYDEELAIVEALAAHDEKAAQEAALRHVQNSLALVLRQSDLEPQAALQAQPARVGVLVQ